MSKLSFASFVWYFDRAYYGVLKWSPRATYTVRIRGRLILKLQSSSSGCVSILGKYTNRKKIGGYLMLRPCFVRPLALQLRRQFCVAILHRRGDPLFCSSRRVVNLAKELCTRYLSNPIRRESTIKERLKCSRKQNKKLRMNHAWSGRRGDSSVLLVGMTLGLSYECIGRERKEKAGANEWDGK